MMQIVSGDMSKTKYAVFDISEIEKYIRQAKICRLGLVDNGYAYIVPLNFGYEDNALYFHMGLKGRKMDLIRENPKVSFEIDAECGLKTGEAACDWNMMYQSVMGQGLAEFIETLEQKRHALNIIMKQYSGKTWQFPDEKLALTTVLKVRIGRISARTNNKGET